MVRFIFGVITGFVAKKYYDENKEQVDKNLKKIIKWIDIDDMSDYEEFEKKVALDGGIINADGANLSGCGIGVISDNTSEVNVNNANL